MTALMKANQQTRLVEEYQTIAMQLKNSSVVLGISDYHLLCAIGKHTLMTTGYDAIHQTDCPSFLKATDVHHPGAHRLTLIAVMAIPSISPMNGPKLAKLNCLSECIAYAVNYHSLCHWVLL